MIFVSHAEPDRRRAMSLVAELEKAGFRCWIAPRDIPKGADFRESILGAIDACAAFMLVFSSHANTSKWVDRELAEADEQEKPVFWIRLEDLQPKRSIWLVLRHIQFLDAFHDAFSAYAAELITEFEERLPGLRAASVIADNQVATRVSQPPRIASSEEWTNSLGMAFRRVPTGTFKMGNEEFTWSQPVHPVQITKPFYMGKYPVTQGEWKALMGKTPAQQEKKAEEEWQLGIRGEGDRYPMYYVSWEEAQAFIAKLNQREPGERYRLPTEAEWEYACRAGSESAYCFGNDEQVLGEYGWYDGNSGGRAHPVGEKLPNAWGLHDMHGNVWEWVQDWYDEAYYKSSPKADPPGPSTGSLRVSRGGGWDSAPRLLRSAFRDNISPGDRGYHLGFRLLRTHP